MRASAGPTPDSTRRSRLHTTPWQSTSSAGTFSAANGTNGTASRGRRWNRYGSRACTLTWGGYHARLGLANISLHWMLSKAEAAGMEVDRRRLRRVRYRPDPHGPAQESYTGFWRFRGQHVRNIPDGSSVHRSVWDRKAKPSNGYSPSNLPNRIACRRSIRGTLWSLGIAFGHLLCSLVKTVCDHPHHCKAQK